MLGRRVGEAIARSTPESVTAPVNALVAEADLVFGNLEAPLCRADGLRPTALRADPAAVAALRGFHVVTLANNHIHDCGDAGVDETLVTLAAAGIRWVGIGADEEAAHAPAIIETRGLRIGFMGCIDGALLPAEPTRHRLAELESDRLLPAVAAARARLDALIVAVHAGNEHVAYPPPSLRTRAAELAAAGADVVLTHHPHVLGCHERVGASLVWHGLGDFVFDGEAATRRRAVVLSVSVGDGPPAFDAIPTVITPGLQVAPAPPRVAAVVRAGIERRSRALLRPAYAVRYPGHYVAGLVRAQVERLQAVRQDHGTRAALHTAVRLARFAPVHASRLVRGRFM